MVVHLAVQGCKQLVAVIPPFYTAAYPNHDCNSNRPPYQEHRHTRKQSFDDSLYEALYPGLESDMCSSISTPATDLYQCINLLLRAQLDTVSG